MKKFLVGLIAIGLVLTSNTSVFAFTKDTREININTISESELVESLDSSVKEITFDLSSNVTQEKEIKLANGESGILGIAPLEKNELEKVSSGTHKIYFYGVVANCSFYVNISNNKITRAYDPWHLMIGASVKSSRLSLDTSKQATYYFEFGTPIWDFGGWTGWLRANINTNNDLVVSIK